MKIAAAIIVFALNIGTAIAVLLFMLMVMNGFNESDAFKGIVTYGILVTVAVLVVSFGTWWFTGRLISKGISSFVVLVLTIPGGATLGILFCIVAAFLGVGIAELARRNF